MSELPEFLRKIYKKIERDQATEREVAKLSGTTVQKMDQELDQSTKRNEEKSQ